MGCKSLMVVLLSVTTLEAQLQAPPAPWRGAGPAPCVGSDGGVYQCPPAPRSVAIRAGRLFDTKTGQLLANQIVLISGERITAAGPEARIRIPAGVQVIDLRQATVLPGADGNPAGVDQGAEVAGKRRLVQGRKLAEIPLAYFPRGTQAQEGGRVELAVTTSRLHFFDLETGDGIYEAAARPREHAAAY